MSEPVIIRGLRQVQELLEQIPRLVREPFAQTVFEIMEDGKRIMRNHVEDTIRTTDKTTGVLARNIDGVVDFRDGGEGGAMYAKIEIGSNMPYAGYASREIGPTMMNQVVFIPQVGGKYENKYPHPIGQGEFRFIGVRPPIPGHPFLERTADELEELISTKYEGKFTEAFISLHRPGAYATASGKWSGTEDLFRSGMTGLFG